MSQEQRLPLPPGRLGLPWLGESLSLLRSNHGFYTDRLAAHGPIFKTRLFGNDFVVFSGHEAFHTFATDPRIVRGDADPITARQMFLDSLALMDGAEHQTRKSVLVRAIGFRSAIEAYLPRMQGLMSELIDSWRTQGTATIRPDLQLFAARLAGALYTGDESDGAARELSGILADMRAAFLTIPADLPGTRYRRAMRGRNRLIEIVDAAIERHRGADYDDVLARLLTAAGDAGVPVQTLRADVRHLIFASQAGLFAPLTLATMEVGRHPEIAARARAEVLEVAPEGPIPMAVLDRLVYLEQISKEVRRYFALNSATFFGRLTAPMEVGGYRIPAGWGAIGGIHINMRNPDVFTDPDRFDPDRFEEKRQAALAPGSYVPHGDGEFTHHRCPAENLVTVAIKLYLALLLRETEWAIPEQDLALTNELFPLPTSGLTVEFRQLKRSSSAVTTG
ncbi:cytochrome P450 [Microbacterium deminutum]|uniref:Cytochrome P450 n=1 Tax=Microbacterium deminutum TaxID=344164 RepID=A0ABP5BRB8_9MICO